MQKIRGKNRLFRISALLSLLVFEISCGGSSSSSDPSSSAPSPSLATVASPGELNPGTAPTSLAVKVGYTTLDASNDWEHISPYRLSDPGALSGPGSAQEIAVPFVLTEGGRLDSVELAMTRVWTTINSGTARKITRSMTNDNKPGATLESWTFVPNFTNERLVKFVSVFQPLLSSGTKYWIICEINPTSRASDYWFPNKFKTKGELLNRNSQEIPWTSTNQILPAFQVKIVGGK